MSKTTTVEINPKPIDLKEGSNKAITNAKPTITNSTIIVQINHFFQGLFDFGNGGMCDVGWLRSSYRKSSTLAGRFSLWGCMAAVMACRTGTEMSSGYGNTALCSIMVASGGVLPVTSL